MCVVGEMSVEELAAKYAGAYASDFEMPDTPSSSEAESNASDLSDLESDEESQPSPQQDGKCPSILSVLSTHSHIAIVLMNHAPLSRSPGENIMNTTTNFLNGSSKTELTH